jgi:hypothetical protein
MSRETLCVRILEKSFTFALAGDTAPRTVQAVLEQVPLEATAYHGITTGMAIVVPVESSISYVENPHVYGAAPGSLLYFPNLNGRCLDGEVCPNELQVSYGITRFADWTGWQRTSVIGELVDGDLNELAAVGPQVRRLGATQIRITRA